MKRKATCLQDVDDAPPEKKAKVTEFDYNDFPEFFMPDLGIETELCFFTDNGKMEEDSFAHFDDLSFLDCFQQSPVPELLTPLPFTLPFEHPPMITSPPPKFMDVTIQTKPITPLPADAIRIFLMRKQKSDTNNCSRNNNFCKTMSCASLGIKKFSPRKNSAAKFSKIIKLLVEIGKNVNVSKITFVISGEYFYLSMNKEAGPYSKQEVFHPSLKECHLFIHPPTKIPLNVVTESTLTATFELCDGTTLCENWQLIYGGNKWESHKLCLKWFEINKSFKQVFVNTTTASASVRTHPQELF